VGHSAAVFDREKLAWVNRHYLRLATPGRLTSLAMPSFVKAGFVRQSADEECGARPVPSEVGAVQNASGEAAVLQHVSGAAREYVESVVPMASGSIDRVEQMPERLRFLSDEARAFLDSVVPLASGSIDRIEQMPERLRFLFVFDPAESIARADVQEVLREPGAREVIECLARELAGAGRLDRALFRATGHKGKHLFHPIRVALTGEAGGPELDLAVPAIDRGAALPASSGVAPILGCRERAALFAEALGRHSE
jgi:nondiscriminating glutamyl-tRNA synthetase